MTRREGNPFEPPETAQQQRRRFVGTIRENVSRRLLGEVAVGEWASKIVLREAGLAVNVDTEYIEFGDPDGVRVFVREPNGYTFKRLS